MEVLSVEEQEDGSAIVILDMTQQENDMLVEHAVLDILRKEMEKSNHEQGTSRNNGELQSKE